MQRKLRKDALILFKTALAAADPEEAIRRHVSISNGRLVAGGKSYQLDAFSRIYVVGAGKPAGAMARAVEKLLGRRITASWVNVKYGHLASVKRITLHECGHPVPDEQGLEGTKRIIEIAKQATAEDLLICLIAGGASALMPAPAPPVTLHEKQETTKLLLSCGATIHEINAVRKHLSLIKGGQLARWAYPAKVLTLILSDVIGDNLDVIGSGPTAPDASTFSTAWKVLEKYDLVDKVPQSVRERLQAGLRGQIEETPKPGDRIFENVQNLIIGSNRQAVEAAAARARELGYRPLILSTFLEGEAREVARALTAIVKEVEANRRPVQPPACLIAGGETTVTVRGDGLGGRNQEFVLAAAIEIQGMQNIVVLAGGTDGTDGPTDAAGAIADGDSLARAEKLGLRAQEFLKRNDSYNFFKPLNDLIMTGPTNTNVMDLYMFLIGAATRR